MKQRWRKLGQIYVLKEGGIHHKLISHVANLLPVHFKGNVFRVFLVDVIYRNGLRLVQ